MQPQPPLSPSLSHLRNVRLTTVLNLLATLICRGKSFNHLVSRASKVYLPKHQPPQFPFFSLVSFVCPFKALQRASKGFKSHDRSCQMRNNSYLGGASIYISKTKAGLHIDVTTLTTTTTLPRVTLFLTLLLLLLLPLSDLLSHNIFVLHPISIQSLVHLSYICPSIGSIVNLFQFVRRGVGDKTKRQLLSHHQCFALGPR